MIPKKRYLVVTFYTTAAAMAAEKRAKEENAAGKLISVPRNLTAECGLAWRGEVSERAMLEALFHGLDVEEFRELEL